MSDTDDFAVVFKALSEPVRLRLLELLPRESEKRAFCVCDLAERLGLSQPCLSHHLAILKSAGLVGVSKRGSHAYYFVNKERLLGRLDEFSKRIAGG